MDRLTVTQSAIIGRWSTFLSGRCLAYGGTVPYLPILDVVRDLFGLLGSDELGPTTSKLQAGLALVGVTSADALPLLLHLLGFKRGTESLAGQSPEALGPVLASLGGRHSPGRCRAERTGRRRAEPIEHDRRRRCFWHTWDAVCSLCGSLDFGDNGRLGRASRRSLI